MVEITTSGGTYTFDGADFRDMGHARLAPPEGNLPAQQRFPDRVFAVLEQVLGDASGVADNVTAVENARDVTEGYRDEAELARDQAIAAAVSSDFPFGVTTGTGSAYVLEFDPERVLANGSAFRVGFHAAPLAGATLKIDDNDAKLLSDVNGGEIKPDAFGAGHVDIAIYDAALDRFKLAYLPSVTLIQQPEAVFPIEQEVISLNPTRLEATPYAPIYSNVGAVMGALTEARFQIATDEAFSTIVHTITRTTAPFNEVFYNIGLLAEDTTHYWRVQYEDAKGNISEWSEPAEFVTAESYLFDMLAFSHPDATSEDNRRVTVYDVDVATFTKQDIIAEDDKIKAGTVYCFDWSASGRWLVVGVNNPAGNLILYDYGDGIPVRVALPSWLITKLDGGVFVVRINKAMNKIFIGGSFTQRAICAEWNEETGIGDEIALPTPPTGSDVHGADWSFDDNYLMFTTLANGASQQNSYIHVYAWVNSIGEPLANPIRLSNPSNQPANTHYGCCFHSRYNQFYACNSNTTNQIRAWSIASNNTITFRGDLPSLTSSQPYSGGIERNAAGTLLVSQNTSGTRTVGLWDIDKADETVIPTFITSATGIEASTTYQNPFSFHPEEPLLAIATNNFPLGAKPKIFDITTPNFSTEITSTIPFAYFTDASTHSSNAVAFRFGRWGYPVEV
jgi:hypothetical protein